jgi:peptide-methionine (R)-S-oxide reductase
VKAIRNPLPAARRVALAVNAARLTLGVALLTDPAGMVRQLGVDQASAVRMSWLARIAGARDAALGTGTAVALLRGHDQRAWLLAGASCDLVDAFVSAQTAQQRRVDPLRGWLMTGVAIATAAAGIAGTIGIRTDRGARSSAIDRAGEVADTASRPDR